MFQFIRTNDTPVIGRAAFNAAPARSSTAEFNGSNIIKGSPGSVAIYSPRPSGMVDSDWNGGKWQPSAVAPDFFFPSIYVALVNRGLKFPGYLGRHTMATQPASSLGALARNLSNIGRIGGRRVTPAIRAFTQWPVYGGQ